MYLVSVYPTDRTLVTYINSGPLNYLPCSEENDKNYKNKQRSCIKIRIQHIADCGP